MSVSRQMADASWQPVSLVLALDSVSGGSYNALDDGATLPGVYNYQLAEVQMDGSTNLLAVCTVNVISAANSSPIIVTIQTEAGGIRLRWTGGTPPYYLEKATSLNQSPTSGVVATPNNSGDITPLLAPASAWVLVPLSDSSTNNVLLPVEDASAFFRVRSGSGVLAP